MSEIRFMLLFETLHLMSGLQEGSLSHRRVRPLRRRPNSRKSYSIMDPIR